MELEQLIPGEETGILSVGTGWVNHPENIVDAVDPEKLQKLWPQIRAAIGSVPSYEDCKNAMQKAGCKITVADIGKEQSLFDHCFTYSPYMRKRLTLLRLAGMIQEFPKDWEQEEIT